MVPVGSSDPRGDRVPEMFAQVDMSSDEWLMRISQHDRCRIGRGRSKEQLIVRQVLRATHDGPDRFVIAFWQHHSNPVPDLAATGGCRVGKTVADEDASVLVAELMFARPLARGKTVVTEHEFTWVSSSPAGQDDACGRVLRHPTREFLLEIDFHPERLPVCCVENAIPDGHPEFATHRPVTLDEDGRTHAWRSASAPAFSRSAGNGANSVWTRPLDQQ